MPGIFEAIRDASPTTSLVELEQLRASITAEQRAIEDRVVDLRQQREALLLSASDIEVWRADEELNTQALQLERLDAALERVNAFIAARETETAE
jgi:hypothetical protein